MLRPVSAFASAIAAGCLVLAACAPAATPAPTQAPTQSPAPFQIDTELPPTPEPTATPAPSATTVPTFTPTLNPGPVTLTLWYGYSPGAAEELALINIVKRVRQELPNYTIRLKRVPWSDLFKKYREAATVGSGPDLLLAPNDELGRDVRDGLIADVTGLTSGRLENYAPRALKGMTVDGKVYGIPESFKAEAFWYNTSLLKTAPQTTDELKALMQSGTPVAITYGCYQHFGFYGSFGGKLFDDQWRFTADKGGFVEGLTYVAELHKISIENNWPVEEGYGLNRFRLGKVVAITNGNWAMGDYRAALGSKLAVAPLPAGPGGPATPFLGVDGFYVNAKSPNKDVAVEVALRFVNAASQMEMMTRAGHVPVRTDVEITDPLIKGLLEAFKTAYVRPQVPQMEKYWTSFCQFDNIYNGVTSPAYWVRLANGNANQ